MSLATGPVRVVQLALTGWTSGTQAGSGRFPASRGAGSAASPPFQRPSVDALLWIGVISGQRIQIRLGVLTILGFPVFFRCLPLNDSPPIDYAGVEYRRNVSALLLPLVQYRFKPTDRDPPCPTCQLGRIRMITSSVPNWHTNRSMCSRSNCNCTVIRTIFNRYFSSPNPFQGLYVRGIH